jgi:hypothetical protein
MKSISLSVFIVVAVVAGGCGMVTRMTTAKGTFNVTVKNESSRPIRIGLTKNGPPWEEEWASPEDVAINNAKHAGATWGQAVLPGQSATLPEISGRFSEGVYGFVRVYADDPALSDMLAMGRHSPNRLDLPLTGGVNRFVVMDDQDRLAAKRLPAVAEPAASETQTRR